VKESNELIKANVSPLRDEKNPSFKAVVINGNHRSTLHKITLAFLLTAIACGQKTSAKTVLPIIKTTFKQKQQEK
jgi:hypothetical protein